MNKETRADEIVRALQMLCGADGQSCTGICVQCPVDRFREKHPNGACDDGTMSAAADLISSLQAQLADKTALLDAVIAGQETLQKALFESQQELVKYHHAEQWLDDMNNPLEPIKVQAAFNSEIMKLNFRREHKPESISELDGTIIAALMFALERGPQQAGEGERHVKG